MPRRGGVISTMPGRPAAPQLGLSRPGAIIGVVAVIVDEALNGDPQRPTAPLAMEWVYLPLESDLLIPFGAVLGGSIIAGP